MSVVWPSTGIVSAASAGRTFELLSSLRVLISEKYLTFGATNGERYSITLQDYIAHEAWAREKRLVCPEDYAADAHFAAGLVQAEDLGLRDAHPARVSIHAAYGGSVSPLHFDWDLSRVHHLCLFGRRRVWLALPGPNQALPAAGNSILADFEAMGSEQRERTLGLMGAIRVDLEVGNFVQFPSFWWHLVEYLETSVAVSVRSEFDSLLRPVTILPRSVELQYLLHGLVAAPEDDKIKVVSALIQAFIGSLAENDVSFSKYALAIRQCERKLGLVPMQSDPWMVSLKPSQQADLARQFHAASEKLLSGAEEVDLCREWLFGYWPSSAPVSGHDSSMLASLMACAMSPAKYDSTQENQI